MNGLWTRGLATAGLLAAISVSAQADSYQLQSDIGLTQPVPLCAQPEGGLLAGNGSVVKEVPCVSSDESQFWRVDVLEERTIGGALYHRSRLLNSGTLKCLDLTDGNAANGTPLQLWTCNLTSTTMQWWYPAALENTPNGFATITNRRSNKCVDVRGGSPLSGTVIQNYGCANLPDGTGNPAQFWRFIPR